MVNLKKSSVAIITSVVSVVMSVAAIGISLLKPNSMASEVLDNSTVPAAPPPPVAPLNTSNNNSNPSLKRARTKKLSEGSNDNKEASRRRNSKVVIISANDLIKPLRRVPTDMKNVFAKGSRQKGRNALLFIINGPNRPQLKKVKTGDKNLYAKSVEEARKNPDPKSAVGRIIGRRLVLVDSEDEDSSTDSEFDQEEEYPNDISGSEGMVDLTKTNAKPEAKNSEVFADNNDDLNNEKEQDSSDEKKADLAQTNAKPEAKNSEATANSNGNLTKEKEQDSSDEKSTVN